MASFFRRLARMMSVQYSDGYFKLRGVERAQCVGVRTPRTIAVLEDVTEVDRVEETSFTIKPVNGNCSRGVFVLHRIGEGMYFDLMRKRSFATADLKRVYDRESVSRHRRQCGYTYSPTPADVWAEESLLGPDGIATEWKFYCFGGVPGMVLQIDRNAIQRPGTSYPFAAKYWDGGFRNLGSIAADGVLHDMGRKLLHEQLAGPLHADELHRAAAVLSSAYPEAFVRIDLYDTPNGVFFGEFTPRPILRANRFVPRIDAWLGDLWEQAERMQCK